MRLNPANPNSVEANNQAAAGTGTADVGLFLAEIMASSAPVNITVQFKSVSELSKKVSKYCLGKNHWSVQVYSYPPTNYLLSEHLKKKGSCSHR